MSEDLDETAPFVNIKHIEPNLDNPRRLFDPEKMEELTKSIHLRGIMVPLIVYKKSEQSDKYVLLDGECRLKCSKYLGLTTVPIREISKPTKTENLIRMFNIHNVRTPWELVPTAFALEKLIHLLEKQGKKTTSTELSKLTGMSPIRISECKRILKYKPYLHLALDSKPEKRISGDFFSQFDLVYDKLKKYPEITKQYPKKKLLEIMIKKKQDGVIDNFIKEFRMLKKILTSDMKGVPKKHIVTNVKEYIKSNPIKKHSTDKTKTKTITIEEIYERTSSIAYVESQVMKKTEDLMELLSDINYSQAKNKKEFKNTLTKLINKITKVLEK